MATPTATPEAEAQREEGKEKTFDPAKGEEQEAEEKHEPLSKTGPIPDISADDDAADDVQEEESEEGAQEGDDKETEGEEVEDAFEALEPMADARTWIIGKPPKEGGKEDQYSEYIQKPLGYMPRQRFFGLVFKTVSESIKAGGVLDLGMDDVFGGGAGSIRQRFQQLTAQDFTDAGSFVALAAQLAANTPDFLLDCYCIWLDVPAQERAWAKATMNQPYDPEREKWGLTEEQGFEMIEIFIDQNYEDIRAFFVERLPRLVTRIRSRERDRKSKVRESESVPSKQ